MKYLHSAAYCRSKLSQTAGFCADQPDHCQIMQKKTGLTSHRNVSQLFTKNHLDKNSNAKNVKNILFFSLQVHNENYDGFRRLSATFEELEERVNASDTDDEDVDDSEDIR